MILPDVNVLLYAFRRDSPQHKIYRDWLAAVINDDMPFGMSPQVLSSVIRIATNPKIYAEPSGIAETIGFCSNLLDQPSCRVIQTGYPGCLAGRDRDRAWLFVDDK